MTPEMIKQHMKENRPEIYERVFGGGLNGFLNKKITLLRNSIHPYDVGRLDAFKSVMEFTQKNENNTGDEDIIKEAICIIYPTFDSNDINIYYDEYFRYSSVLPTAFKLLREYNIKDK